MLRMVDLANKKLKTLNGNIFFYLNIFGKKYFAVLFYEWGSILHGINDFN